MTHRFREPTPYLVRPSGSGARQDGTIGYVPMGVMIRQEWLSRMSSGSGRNAASDFGWDTSSNRSCMTSYKSEDSSEVKERGKKSVQFQQGHEVFHLKQSRPVKQRSRPARGDRKKRSKVNLALTGWKAESHRSTAQSPSIKSQKRSSARSKQTSNKRIRKVSIDSMNPSGFEEIEGDGKYNDLLSLRNSGDIVTSESTPIIQLQPFIHGEQTTLSKAKENKEMPLGISSGEKIACNLTENASTGIYLSRHSADAGHKIMKLSQSSIVKEATEEHHDKAQPKLRVKPRRNIKKKARKTVKQTKQSVKISKKVSVDNQGTRSVKGSTTNSTTKIGKKGNKAKKQTVKVKSGKQGKPVAKTLGPVSKTKPVGKPKKAIVQKSVDKEVQTTFDDDECNMYSVQDMKSAVEVSRIRENVVEDPKRIRKRSTSKQDSACDTALTPPALPGLTTLFDNCPEEKEADQMDDNCGPTMSLYEKLQRKLSTVKTKGQITSCEIGFRNHQAQPASCVFSRNALPKTSQELGVMFTNKPLYHEYILAKLGVLGKSNTSKPRDGGKAPKRRRKRSAKKKAKRITIRSNTIETS